MADDEARRPEPEGAGLRARQEYWRELYEQHHEAIRRYFARHVRHPHDVDDLMQTVFLNLIARGGDLQNPRAYLFAVARHQLSLYWRHRRRSVLVEQIISGGEGEGAAGAGHYDYESDPLEQIGRRETQTVMALMIGSLSAALKDALRVRYIDGLRLNAAATHVGCSRMALKKRLQRAKQSLLESLKVGGSYLR
jgi:RNA polymerase sigma factor (sigma-70 family)